MYSIGIDVIRNIWLCDITFVVRILQNGTVTFYNIYTFKNRRYFFLNNFG